MTTNFRADTNPGKYAENREHNRGAVYYYYCCSLAQAFLAAEGKTHWADPLADALLERQRTDGSWSNPLVPQREDDPVVASAFAALALACCRESLTGKHYQAFTEP